MNYDDENIEKIVNNEFDYSNIIATGEMLSYLVQYCDQVFNWFLKLIEQDEQKNQKLKFEYQNYNYKKTFSERFDIIVRQKNSNNITCRNYISFNNYVKSGQLKNVNSLEMVMQLDYKRGNNGNLMEHENIFRIVFKPYDIKFTRKSKFNEADMNQIENAINDILKGFPVANTIFCSK